MASTRLGDRFVVPCTAARGTGAAAAAQPCELGGGARSGGNLRLLGLPCTRAPRLSSLFDVNHVGVGVGIGVGVLRVVCLLSSTYRGGVLP